jgi:hypothetical protein
MSWDDIQPTAKRSSLETDFSLDRLCYTEHIPNSTTLLKRLNQYETSPLRAFNPIVSPIFMRIAIGRFVSETIVSQWTVDDSLV